MLSYSVFLPSYSVGEDCYQQIPYVTRKYGKTAVVIGGKTAMEKARQELDAALQGSDVRQTVFYFPDTGIKLCGMYGNYRYVQSGWFF